MGADMHWLIERQHNDGTWYALLDDNSAFEAITIDIGRPFSDAYGTPVQDFRHQDYTFFSMLADVRSEDFEHPKKLLMCEDLPSDMAPATRAWCDECNQLYSGYHTPGWASLGRIKRWSPDWCEWDDTEHETRADREQKIEFRRESLFKILEDTRLFKRTLGLPLRSDDDGLDFGLSQKSAHEVIQDHNILADLRPIADDTLRVFFRFDS
jgi:hypothetical protein